MPMPYYVSPEQMMQDKAEYAKKGIAKGRSIIAMEYVDGILLAAENPSASLHKISEIYDSIAFAGAGKYSELKICGRPGSGMRTSRASCIAVRRHGPPAGQWLPQPGDDFQPGDEAA